MLDIKLIRENSDLVISSLNKRGEDYSEAIYRIIQLDKKWREAQTNFDSLRNEQKNKSKLKGKPSQEDIANMQNLANEVKKIGAISSELKVELDQALMALPNMPDDDLLDGGKENNKIINEFGKYTEPTFSLQDHYTLCNKLDLIDYERGVKLAGNGNWIYKGKGALLEWALINFFVEKHLKNGYEFILPPHILTEKSGYCAGQFPKFIDDVFLIENNIESNEKKFLLPTSETAIINFYRDEILKEEDLPMKVFAYSPCYRRESASHADERGTIRGQQFNKVEMFHFAHPNNSLDSFNEILEQAISLVRELGLHFNVTKLASGDISASMRRTYDIEVLIPSLGYKEVSSVSNSGCFQARRSMIRYKDKDNNKHYIHTLNGSGLATSRLIPAIVEQFQTKDGRVVVPEVLQKWLGAEII